MLHAAGATVVAAARRTDRLEALAGELGDRLVPMTCDVSVDADCERLVADAIALDGHLDVLVNNAGIGAPVAAEDEPIDGFRQVVDVNLNGLFLLSQLAGRHMIERRSGTIVNLASVLGLVGSAPIKQASYCATKGAVVNLTRELGVQWARKGVRVNALGARLVPVGDDRADVHRRGRQQHCHDAQLPDGPRPAEPAHELDGRAACSSSPATRPAT